MSSLDLQWQTLKSLLDWRVSLDILLIALGMFFLYHTLRTTGTVKIVTGLGIAAVVFLAARILNLQGIEWIYANLSPVLLLAIIIIFQPEIRKIFERAASIQPKEEVRESTKLSYLIADVMFALARQKRGAIVVFPGKESVKAWISEGISLDAKVSFPLLLSIFDPHSPGHDGAIVVEKGRVSAFGARLPLSRAENLLPEFGTRHHAALGLCEVTDALVIVVSEERGAVSVFDQGSVNRIADKSKLATGIARHLESTASFEMPGVDLKNRKRLVTELVISIFLAFLFWSTVILTQNGK